MHHILSTCTDICVRCHIKFNCYGIEVSLLINMYNVLIHAHASIQMTVIMCIRDTLLFTSSFSAFLASFR